ncbi:MAG TPA: type IV secretion system protein [Trebonia sp.]|nr:type IV secretion system protein [Trebonia sp.]
MAEPDSRAGRSERVRRTRPARALTRAALLAGAILTVLLGGLLFARPAGAATTAPAQPAAHAAVAALQPRGAQPPQTPQRGDYPSPRTPLEPAKLDALTQPDGGVCAVPGIGDILGLAGLCNSGSAGVVGDLNNICTPSVPQPEQASAGVDSMIDTPGGTPGGKTLYDQYGIAGQYWAATGLQCSEMTSLIGNNVAGMVFDMAKSLDRVTITVYQSAAGNNILTWLQSAVNRLITALGNAIYFPYLSVVVIIGAIWLAWQGLIRKRATRTIEGTIWMVLACAAAVWLIGRPGDFTGVGTTVSNSVTQVLNVAFAKLPNNTGSSCLPVAGNDPQAPTADYAFTSSNGLVDQNANELWSVLVCKPWLAGELGTTQYAKPGTPAAATNVVNLYGRQLLWAQAIAVNEQPTQAVITAKQDAYTGIAQSLHNNYPAVYPLFQGNQWTSRLELGFLALFAAVAAGLLVLLIALTLIILKIGFLLLLVAGPFFLIIGTHPGFGRVIAIRWFEMLVGVLMKQIAIALVLSVLLYCYSLIMSTTDQQLPWALKIMMIALVTVAVFIYRKPFQHLFSSVGYGVIGSTERAEYSWREASVGFRRVSANAAGVAVPGVGAYRAARWARRNPAAAAAAAGAGGAMAGAAMAGSAGEDAAAGASAGGTTADGHTAPRLRPDGTAPGGDDYAAGGASAAGPNGSGGSGGGAPGGARARQWPEAGGGGRAAPPLPLPPSGGSAPEGASAGWARGSARTGTTTSRPANSAPAGPVSNGHRGGPAPSAGSSNGGAAPPPVARATSNGGAPRTSGASRGSAASGSGSTASGNGAAGTRGPAPVRQSARGGGAPRPAGGSGWPGTGATARSAESNGTASGAERPSPMPFWLRPIRRGK